MKLAFVLLVAACGSSSPAPTPPTPPSGSGGSGNADAVSIDTLGEPCGDNDACGAGQACVKYFGIAGPRGPELESCEIRCADETPCPTGTTCRTIADGPGQVCRP